MSGSSRLKLTGEIGELEVEYMAGTAMLDLSEMHVMRSVKVGTLTGMFAAVAAYH